MAEHTYEELKKMTVAQLREIAHGNEHEALKGHTTMHKEHLLPALCKALDIHVPHAVAGAGKAPIKASIRKLKALRDEALAAGDRAKLADIRHQIHVMKRKLRRMATRI